MSEGNIIFQQYKHSLPTPFSLSLPESKQPALWESILCVYVFLQKSPKNEHHKQSKQKKIDIFEKFFALRK